LEPEGVLEAAERAAGALLVAGLPGAELEFDAVPAADCGAWAELSAAGAAVLDGVPAGELSALGVDEPAVGAGEAAWLVSALEFDEACFDDPPEQAPPSKARVLIRAT
jgi:hypothetical protein